MRILVVEDEKGWRRICRELLRREGYTVDVSNDGVSGLDNVFIGDLRSAGAGRDAAGLDGFALLQRLRSTGSRLPVLMLTARGELSDRVRGLDQGADYYLTKALSDAGAAGLRAPAAAAEATASGGDDPASIGATWCWIRGRFQVTCGQRSGRLSRKEYDLLEMLMATAGRSCPGAAAAQGLGL